MTAHMRSARSLLLTRAGTGARSPARCSPLRFRPRALTALLKLWMLLLAQITTRGVALLATDSNSPIFDPDGAARRAAPLGAYGPERGWPPSGADAGRAKASPAPFSPLFPVPSGRGRRSCRRPRADRNGDPTKFPARALTGAENPSASRNIPSRRKVVCA